MHLKTIRLNFLLDKTANNPALALGISSHTTTATCVRIRDCPDRRHVQLESPALLLDAQHPGWTSGQSGALLIKERFLLQF